MDPRMMQQLLAQRGAAGLGGGRSYSFPGGGMAPAAAQQGLARAVMARGGLGGGVGAPIAVSDPMMGLAAQRTMNPAGQYQQALGGLMGANQQASMANPANLMAARNALAGQAGMLGAPQQAPVPPMGAPTPAYTPPAGTFDPFK